MTDIYQMLEDLKIKYDKFEHPSIFADFIF